MNAADDMNLINGDKPEPLLHSSDDESQGSAPADEVGAEDSAAAGEVSSTGQNPPSQALANQPTSSKPVPAARQPKSNLAGLGVDIIEIARMAKAFERVPRMRDRLFTAAEISYAESKAKPITHYALFFAAKEAVLKALGTGLRGIGWTDVEVRHSEHGRPYPHLSGAAKAEAERQGVLSIELSLSYTHQVGVASAVAIREQDQPPRVEKVDAKAELLKQFKQLRSLLDELESGYGEQTEQAVEQEPEEPQL
ncbi:MAG: holo-ACP synthase [Coriobacteriales bacterium]|jgi:holo-[acyl-carrier protein] synthase|nr:holo-ACP synthase [Coriobacteriales bacterium]